MANANAGSERTSQPSGTPGGASGTTSNEDRVVAGPDGPERAAGGSVAGSGPTGGAGHQDVGKEPGDRSPVTSTGSSQTGTDGGASRQNPAGHGGGTGDEPDPARIAGDARAERDTPNP